MRKVALLARARLLRVVPDAVEQVRLGWRVIAYRVPTGKSSSRYFAFIAPYDDEVRLGFERGIDLDDPHELLRGNGKQVRYISLRHPRDVTDQLHPYIAHAAAIGSRPTGATR